MHINYFDFGLHKGDEIQMFLDSVKELTPSKVSAVNVYGFEAHPNLAQSVASRYGTQHNVKIFNKAIASENSKVKLYIAESNKMEGNSIFSTKSNVNTDNYVEVDGILFSDWLLDNVPDYKDAINVVRFNIEGAELYLMANLLETEIYKDIDLFLGSSGGDDILKCSEIAHLHDGYERNLKENGINVHQFCAVELPNIKNISPEQIREIIKRAVNERQ